MPKNVQLPDGSIVEFPDGMSDDAIGAAIKANQPSSAATGTDAQKGTLSSFADSAGLSGLVGAIAHPIDTVSGIPAAISGEYNRVKSEVNQGVQDYKKTGLSDTTRRDFGRAVPVFGPALAEAQAQHDAGNNAGMAGTLAGTVAGFVGPEIAAKGIGLASKGAGGALKLASADAPSLKLMATRALTKGTPGELLESALKPGVKYGANADQMLGQSLPHVIAADPALKGVSGFASASDAARASSYEPINNLISPYRRPVGLSEVTDKGLPAPLSEPVAGAEGPFRPSAINGNPIANAQMRSIPLMDMIEKPATQAASKTKIFDIPAGEGGTMRMGAQLGGEAQGGIINQTKALADNYRKDYSIPALDTVKGESNAKLNAFYGKAKGDQAAALSNPETARVKAVGDTIRKVLYPQLEQDAGLPAGSVADMQKKYGILSDVSDIANKREPIFSRHDPVTLGQKIAISAGSNPLSTATKFMTQKMIDKITNSDALVNSAVDQYKNPLRTPIVSRPNLLPRAATATGNFLQSNPLTNAMANIPLNGIPTGINSGYDLLKDRMKR
jgi:hypothetical protein